MIGATKRWFRRNRRGLAIGAGVIGAGYMAGQYVVNKIFETRERMSSDRIAREKSVFLPRLLPSLSLEKQVVRVVNLTTSWAHDTSPPPPHYNPRKREEKES